MLNNHQKSWIKRREKYGPSGRGKEPWDTRVERYGPTGRKSDKGTISTIKRISKSRVRCPECNSYRLIGCIRYDPSRMYYHCSGCGLNIRDREEVTKIFKLMGM